MMFHNARNIRISGTPTFQNIQGSYHYNDHTSNTTNNNTTNITGNDFSQTVHNHNTYTVAHSQSYTEGDRRSHSQPEASIGVPLHAHHPHTIQSPPYTQHTPPLSDTQDIQPFSHRFNTTNPVLSSLPLPHTPHSLGGAAYGFSQGHHMASILPGHIVAMSPEVSSSIIQLFRTLEEQVAREEGRDGGTVVEADVGGDGDRDRGGGQEYRDTAAQLHPATAASSHFRSERSGTVHRGARTQLPPSGQLWEWAASHQSPQPPRLQNSYGVPHPQNQNNVTSTPYAPYTPFLPEPDQFSQTNQQPNANSNLNANSNSNPNSNHNRSHNHSNNPIPPRVRRTLQAAFAFNSHLGESSTSTTSSSTEYDYTRASTSSTALPFAFTNENAGGNEPRMDVYDGTVVETRRTENVNTVWAAHGEDVGRVPVRVQKMWDCEGDGEQVGGDWMEGQREGEDASYGAGVCVGTGADGATDERMRWAGNQSALDSTPMSMGYVRA